MRQPVKTDKWLAGIVLCIGLLCFNAPMVLEEPRLPDNLVLAGFIIAMAGVWLTARADDRASAPIPSEGARADVVQESACGPARV